MNYYERHIGDYLKDTSHLSLLEHGVYSRLLDVYFTREDGIPEKDAARLIGARSKDEREALQSVLGEFFTLVDGLFRQGRADREIAAFLDGEPDREAKRENAAERQRRARQHRRDLFEQLRGHGIVLAFDATTRELEAALSRVTSQQTSHDAERDESRSSSHTVTRDNTATHTHTHTQKKNKTTLTTFAPPDWIPKAEWDAWMPIRKGKRAANTPHALGLIVKDLAKWREAGHDVKAILEKSIRAGWSDVYEPKPGLAVVNGAKPSPFA